MVKIDPLTIVKETALSASSKNTKKPGKLEFRIDRQKVELTL